MNRNQLNKALQSLAVEMLNDANDLQYQTMGWSMYPTMRPGDTAIVCAVKPDDCSLGDILVFKSDQHLIAHRLVEIRYIDGKRFFITRGDNNRFLDKPFSETYLLGRIQTFKRGNRNISMDGRRMRWNKYMMIRIPKTTVILHRLGFSMSSRIRRTKEVMRSVGNHTRMISRWTGKSLFINALLSILQGVLPFALIVLVKLLVDMLSVSGGTDASTLYLWLGLTGLTFILSMAVNESRTYFTERMAQLVTQNSYEQLHAKHTSLNLSHYENHVQLDKIHRAVQEASYRPVKLLNEILTALRSVAAGIFLLGIFITIGWSFVLLLFVAIIPGILQRLLFAGRWHKLKEENSPKERRMHYFSRILTGYPFAKEIRLFGFAHFFREKFIRLQKELFKDKLQLRKTEALWSIAAQAFSILLLFASFAYVAWLQLNGAISIGTVVLFFFAFQRGYGVLNDFFRSMTQIMEDTIFLDDFTAFLAMSSSNNRKDTVQHPQKLTNAIKIEDVSFSYENSKRPALQNVCMTIPAGKKIAIVGANGSGKTTLIKLLCGFYAPDSGSVLLDDTDIKELGQEQVCRNISAVFQDFAMYNLPVLDNLALGDINHPFDLEKARRAAALAGLEEVIEKLPQGYHTLLGNQFIDGEELSIGQWQKMAIARAFYRDTPILLMDEPSSALDAHSEQQIIETLKVLSEQKTAVIISHRLTTVQWVDLIYVLDAGRVTEFGNHEDLMALKGRYYDLYNAARLQRTEEQ